MEEQYFYKRVGHPFGKLIARRGLDNVELLHANTATRDL